MSQNNLNRNIITREESKDSNTGTAADRFDDFHQTNAGLPILSPTADVGEALAHDQSPDLVFLDPEFPSDATDPVVLLDEDGHVTVHQGFTIKDHSETTLKIGDVITNGPNKGWIHCQTKAGEAFAVAAKDTPLRLAYASGQLADSEVGVFPSIEQLEAMYAASKQGLIGNFNTTGSFHDGVYYISAESHKENRSFAYGLRFSDGAKSLLPWVDYSVRFVRPQRPA